MDNNSELPVPEGRKEALMNAVKPMTVELLARIIDENHPVTSLLTPSVIEDIGSSPQGLDLLKRFEVIFFGGAPLSPKIGDIL